MDWMESFIIEQLQESAELKRTMAESMIGSIKEAAEAVIDALRSGGKVLLCGNGGSAADSQHIAAEFVGRFRFDRKAMPAIALTTDTSILTAVGNDYGYDEVFRRQVEALGHKGDVLIGISTSGRSPNVLRAIEEAKERGMVTIALIGGKECPMSEISDITVQIPSEDSPRIQEGHMTFGHILCDLVEKTISQPSE